MIVVEIVLCLRSKINKYNKQTKIHLVQRKLVWETIVDFEGGFRKQKWQILWESRKNWQNNTFILCSLKFLFSSTNNSSSHDCLLFLCALFSCFYKVHCLIKPVDISVYICIQYALLSPCCERASTWFLHQAPQHQCLLRRWRRMIW